MKTLWDKPGDADVLGDLKEFVSWLKEDAKKPPKRICPLCGGILYPSGDDFMCSSIYHGYMVRLKEEENKEQL